LIKINYFDKREFLVRREIKTKSSKSWNGTQSHPNVSSSVLGKTEIVHATFLFFKPAGVVIAPSLQDQ
jgi:hypothetical protein